LAAAFWDATPIKAHRTEYVRDNRKYSIELKTVRIETSVEHWILAGRIKQDIPYLENNAVWILYFNELGKPGYVMGVFSSRHKAQCSSSIKGNLSWSCHGDWKKIWISSNCSTGYYSIESSPLDRTAKDSI
jgi:hypothetical protein